MYTQPHRIPNVCLVIDSILPKLDMFRVEIGGRFHPTFELSSLWKNFEKPFGHEVKVFLAGRMWAVPFIPYLSSVELYPPPTPDDPTPPPVCVYTESEPAYRRQQFMDSIRAAAETFPLILDGKVHQIDSSRSSFSVLWQPVSFENALLSGFVAPFLTFYTFSPCLAVEAFPSAMSLPPAPPPRATGAAFTGIGNHPQLFAEIVRWHDETDLVGRMGRALRHMGVALPTRSKEPLRIDAFGRFLEEAEAIRRREDEQSRLRREGRRARAEEAPDDLGVEPSPLSHVHPSRLPDPLRPPDGRDLSAFGVIERPLNTLNVRQSFWGVFKEAEQRLPIPPTATLQLSGIVADREKAESWFSPWAPPPPLVANRQNVWAPLLRFPKYFFDSVPGKDFLGILLAQRALERLREAALPHADLEYMYPEWRDLHGSVWAPLQGPQWDTDER
eukprot:gnl/Chilomastix_cuspidata/1132.p2 GENE.gnl/Chilomastix_cuspidata/1132~~gnl/Chilomastix_cuspidata/1132.p2  ORF type:complete len:444 (+),score=228.65 gnl/Chilomastix_cuspidata/1132:839-2170(+)